MAQSSQKFIARNRAPRQTGNSAARVKSVQIMGGMFLAAASSPVHGCGSAAQCSRWIRIISTALVQRAARGLCQVDGMLTLTEQERL